jgi:transposase/pimeloyl-ACP methyl ester carboxylesterase
VASAEGKSSRTICEEVGVSPPTVTRWLNRYEEEGLPGLLRDRPRSGRPKRIKPDKVAEVIRLTQEGPPPELGTHWSTRTLAPRVGVHPTTVHRIWKAHGLQPHRVRTFKLSKDPQFIEKLHDVVGLYLNPPERAVVFSVDAKTQIQALDRTQPGLPLKKGRAGTMTHDYKRHSSLTCTPVFLIFGRKSRPNSDPTATMISAGPIERTLPILRTLILIAATLAAGPVGAPAQALPEALAEPAPGSMRCTALGAADVPALGYPLVITSAAVREAAGPVPPPPGSPPWMAPTPALPAHCEVLGKVDDREGMDGQRYAIGFRLRLPADWNGRLLFQGGGGTDGNVGDAIGRVTEGAPTALDRGFAVVSTDAGHDNRVNYDPARQGTVAFGFDHEARVDYAERSLDVVARVARKLVEAYFGRAADRAYFMGCSNGGRQGMVLAQRFAEHFDGIVASAPGIALPRAAVAQAWDTQQLARLAREMDLVDEAGRPMLNRTFTDEDLALVSDAVREACDTLDGLEDGMVSDFAACTSSVVGPSLERRLCPGAKTDGCLTRNQAAALERIVAGPTNANGAPLYAEGAWDTGIGGRAGGAYFMGWRIWKIGAYDTQTLSYPINVTLGSPALSALFITPPTPVPNDPHAHLAFQLGFDMDTDAPRIYATTPEFPRSSWDLIAAWETDLSAFRARGGRMIVPHGVSDPVFSIHDTRRWWEAVDSTHAGEAAEFVRFFAVPGMAHCGGGPATDRFDALAAIVAWVEAGDPPHRMEASAGETSPWPNRTRPLCPHPKVAHYTGSGSIEDADNFTCR